MKQLTFLVVMAFYSTLISGRNIRRNPTFTFYHNFSANVNYLLGNLERETLLTAEEIACRNLERCVSRDAKQHIEEVLNRLKERQEEIHWVVSDFEYEAEIAGADISKCIGNYISKISDISKGTADLVTLCVNEKVRIVDKFVKNELAKVQAAGAYFQKEYDFMTRKCEKLNLIKKKKCLENAMEESQVLRNELFVMLHNLGEDLQDITINFKPNYLRQCSSGLMGHFIHNSKDLIETVKTCLRENFGTLYAKCLNYGIQITESSIKIVLAMIFVQLMLNLNK